MQKLLSFLLATFIISTIFGYVISQPQKAEAACAANPIIWYKTKTSGVRSVIYHLYVVNRCGAKKTIQLDVASLPTNPKLSGHWNIITGSTVHGDDQYIRRTLNAGQRFDYSVKVTRDINVHHTNGKYYDVIFRAIVREGGSNTNYRDTLKMYYEVLNRPDLSFRTFDLKSKSFRYWGGRSCETTNPKVVFRNLGYEGTDRNVVVKVTARNNGATVTKTVTQTISKREVIDVSDKFRNMPLPYPGTWTAKAEVDVGNNVREENENDNSANWTYTTTPCLPKGSHGGSNCNVSTGWTCDKDNYSKSLEVHFYEGSKYLGKTLANKPRPDAASQCGGNQNVGFSWATPASLKDGIPHSITAKAINIGPAGNNPNLSNTPKTIQCGGGTTITPEPGGFTIKGGVYNDVDESGTKAGTESYISGNIEIYKSGVLVDSTTSVPGAGFESISLDAGEYTIFYTNPIPDGSTLTYPVPNPFVTPQITAIVGPSCTEPAGSPVKCSSGSVTNVDFGLATPDPALDPTNWTQSLGGDVRIDYNWENLIPSPISGGTNYFTNLFNNPDLDHGIVFDNGIDLDQGEYNSNNWSVKNETYQFPIKRTSYLQVIQQLNIKNVYDSAPSLATACGDVTNCNFSGRINAGTSIYKHGEPTSPGSNVTINTAYNFSDGKSHIFILNSDLTINADITAALGSSVMFVVKGDITIGPGVTNLHGIYSTDGVFKIEEGTDEPLDIQGSIIALDGSEGYINERFSGTDIDPAITIRYRPDFVLNAPPLIKYTNYNIKEVAPGTILE